MKIQNFRYIFLAVKLRNATSTRKVVTGVDTEEQLPGMYEEMRRLMGITKREPPIEAHRWKRTARLHIWGQITLYISAVLGSAALIGILLQLTFKNAGLF